MNDEELTRLAVTQLIAEGEKFKRRHELRYRSEEPARLRPNLRYFQNTLKSCVSSNVREENMRRSKATEELKYLDNKVKKKKVDEEIVKTTEKKQTKKGFTQHGLENYDSYNSKHKAIPKTHEDFSDKNSNHICRKQLKKARS